MSLSNYSNVDIEIFKYIKLYNYTLPISEAILFNLSIDLLINTILSPRLANSLAYSFPMPSVDPVTTIKI